MSTLHEQTGSATLQFNVECLARPKCEIIQDIAYKNCIFVILLQETHSTSDDRIKTYGFSLVGAIHHDKHGITKLVRNDLPAKFTDASKPDSEMQWLTVTISNEFTVTNIYNPPSAVFLPPPIYSHPVIYSEDFNSRHKSWGYTNNDPDGAALPNGQARMILIYYTIQKNQRHFIRLSGTLSLTQILHSTRLKLIISLHI